MSDAAATWTRGDWMQTYSGRRFYPLDPRADELADEDIAHALSLLCRYGGHVERFYSVAEHCVLMSEWVDPAHALAALLHDATEAYVVDVPRPLKRQLPAYRDIEAAVWFAIASRFGLELELPAQVHEADNRILLTERAALLPRAEVWTLESGLYVDGAAVPLEALPVTVTGWQPAEAERRYLDRLAELRA